MNRKLLVRTSRSELVDQLPVFLLPFLTYSRFSTALQSGRSDEVRPSLQFGGRGARRRRLHPQLPRPQRSGGSLRQRGPRARRQSVCRLLPLPVHRQTGPEQGLTIIELAIRWFVSVSRQHLMVLSYCFISLLQLSVPQLQHFCIFIDKIVGVLIFVIIEHKSVVTFPIRRSKNLRV